MKVLITGASGFIGTNLVSYLYSKGHDLCALDIRKPQQRLKGVKYVKCDIINISLLQECLLKFNPVYIIHLAAETRLSSRVKENFYAANITGVENILKAANSIKGLEKVLFASTKLVINGEVGDLKNYDPHTAYGESKVLGEKLILDSSNTFETLIMRPTSHWGPWSLSEHIPYGRFFIMIKRGIYFHPEIANSPRIFGFVLNTCYQIHQLMISDKTSDKEIYYLGDYDPIVIEDWANLISRLYGRGKVRVIPEFIICLLAKIGDILKLIGFKEPPFSSFRLENMRKSTLVPLEETKKIAGNLPFNLEEGSELTINWLNEQD